MQLEDSPFRSGWWGSDLQDVGLDEHRPFVGTYACYDFARLPSLPFGLTGDFQWLTQARPHARNIGENRSEKNFEALNELHAICEAKGIQLPASFTKFFSTPTFQQRIRSNTDCFLFLSDEMAPSPVGDGHLIRFLADSQGCVFWYVYLNQDGSDHAVVAAPDFYGTEAEKYNDGAPDPSAIVFSAESFESFLCRFWLENEIWFAVYEKSSMPDAGRTYIENYGKPKSR